MAEPKRHEQMTIEEAMAILEQGKSAGAFELIRAAGCIMEHCEDSHAVTVADMLRCLDFPGLPAEPGARALYVRTGRDGLGWNAPDSLDKVTADKEYWIAYLGTHGLLTDPAANTPQPQSGSPPGGAGPGKIIE